MSNYLAEFATLSLIHFLAVASPGPDLAVTLRQSITYGRVAAIWTSIGVGIGILVHVTYCILGLGILISQSIIAFNIIKYIGAAYLIYVGISALRAKSQKSVSAETAVKTAPTAYKSFMLGFITNVLNPKVTLFFLAVFSVTVSASTPVTIKIIYGLWMAFATMLWFGCLSIFFSRPAVRNKFLEFGHWFERFMGGLLIALGIKLALTSAR